MILIMLGSSQNLNMKHKEERTTIKLLLWTRSPGVDYSRITAEAAMVMKKPPVTISPSGRVPGRALEPSRDGFGVGGRDGTFRGI